MTAAQNDMTAIEIARRLSELGQVEQALQAYTLALKQEQLAPADYLEAACVLLQYGEDYKIAYNAFLALHREGNCRSEVVDILTDAFYLPNVDDIKARYEKNCALLSGYSYLFRKDFLPFEELPVRFYPYDDNGMIPYTVGSDLFGQYTDVNEPVISHHFFRDLSKPVLAKDIFSQYELEYLVDNVRRSDWVGRDNHVYLHYTDWTAFCSYLQILDIEPLLREEKTVFLFENEISQYPINFKERFGIDYSRFSVKPLGVREISRIIWHTQLYAHNGGDFFNEILHGHPCLIPDSSIMFDITMGSFRQLLDDAEKIEQSGGVLHWSDKICEKIDRSILEEFTSLPDRSLKDAMVTYYLGQNKYTCNLDPDSRIVPAIVYQPHFRTITSSWSLHASGKIIASCNAYDEIRDSGLLQQFKYVKAFTPMRRSTNSYAATMRFILKQSEQGFTFSTNPQEISENTIVVVTDCLFDRIMNRSFMVNPNERLLKDSRIVRFEDGKLNPTATFTALAEFLDIPYTESMTYCSNNRGKNPLYEGVAIGLDPAPVYRTYDDCADEYERALMEYLLRDSYEYYGYGFNYYDGAPMSQDEIESLLEKCQRNFDFVRRSHMEMKERARGDLTPEELDKQIREFSDKTIQNYKNARLIAVRFLRHGLKFCSADGTLLHMMEPLRLDHALLQQPLYH